jgi:predicted Zn-dependent protease
VSITLKQIEDWFRELTGNLEFGSLRYVREHSEYLSVRRNVIEPVSTGEDEGVMVTVREGHGMGYAATCDLTREGIRRATDRARGWACNAVAHSLMDYSKVPFESVCHGEYRTPVRVPWTTVSLQDKIELLRLECERLKTDERVVDWDAALWYSETESLYITGQGTRIHQIVNQIVPMLSCTANQGSDTVSRTFGGRGFCRQGGLEVLEQTGFSRAAPGLAEEALELLAAPNCPTGKMDVLLAPDQLILPLHESIGHPLELDRILGDERNYAGTSFVTPDMFGHYQYGSQLLNVTFDPSRHQEFASYAFDDDGLPAHREYIIKDGILVRGLGGITSQARIGLSGVANSRATSWNRPPIDRMANLNLEPGSTSFEEMVADIETGILLQTNCSWSIDDSRNKFQFGCERGQTIRDGELRGVVKKPNYRGLSATFWRNLKRVGNDDTFEVLGTPYCGKGEPNHVIRVGHAAPACVFSDVDVFGGA